jgi:hypothetical protein
VDSMGSAEPPGVEEGVAPGVPPMGPAVLSGIDTGDDTPGVDWTEPAESLGVLTSGVGDAIFGIEPEGVTLGAD